MRATARATCFRALRWALGAGGCSIAASTAYSRFEGATSLGSFETNVRPEPERDDYKYVICGGGSAAQAAADVLAEGDPEGAVLVVTPWWFGPLPSTELVEGTSVRALNARTKQVVLSTGRKVGYSRVLIAVGGDTPTPPAGKVLAAGARAFVGGVRSAIDRARVLQTFASVEPGVRPHFTLVGGSWLALAAGAELVARGADVTWVYAESAFLARHVPKYISAELRRRLRRASDGGSDFLAYAAIRHIIPREDEAEVYAGVVFDRLAAVQFRTDRVLFAPTAPPAPSIRAPLLERRAGGFVVNRELCAASDVYAAGACALAPNMDSLNWSEQFAVASGRHAARNMLGVRAPFEIPRGENVKVPALRLQLQLIGDVDGSLETLGYFACTRDGGDETCGGALRNGAVFYLEPKRVPGAPCTFSVVGVLLWNGVYERETGEGDMCVTATIMDAMQNLVDAPARERRLVEGDLDEFAKVHLGIELDAAARSPEVGRVLWRRHVAARNTPARNEELLWLEDGVLGLGEVASPQQKKAEAYSDLLRKSAGL